MRRLFIYLLLLFLCCCSDEQAGGTTDVDIEIGAIGGKLVTKEGFPASNAEVTLYRLTGIDAAEAVDTVTTNSLGAYIFTGQRGGIYHLSSHYKDSIFGSKRNIDHIQTTYTDLLTDTLLAPGVLEGYARIDQDNHQGILVYIPGTSYIAYTDATGFYRIHKLPQGDDYTLSFQMYGYSGQNVEDIQITSEDTTKLDTVKLINNLHPTGLSSTYDTVNNIITLSWDPMDSKDIKGYNIYRKVKENNNEYTLLNTELLCTDTFYQDVIDDELFSQDTVINFRYGVKGKKLNDDLTSFSLEKIDVAVKSNKDSTMTPLLTKVVSPAFGDTLLGGTSSVIEWSYKGLIDSVKIEFSTSDGASWIPIISRVENKGSYKWITRNTTENNCRIRISSLKDSTIETQSARFSIKKVTNDLITNGSFTHGEYPWNLELFENAQADFYVRFEQANINIKSVPDELWHVGFNQSGIPLIAHSTYRLKFDMRSTAPGHLIKFNITELNYPHTIFDKDSVYLTTDMRTYTMELTMDTTINDMNGALLLHAATAIGEITFDNVSFEKLP